MRRHGTRFFEPLHRTGAPHVCVTGKDIVCTWRITGMGMLSKRAIGVSPPKCYEMRDELCASLWQKVCDGPNREEIEMNMRDAKRAREL